MKNKDLEKVLFEDLDDLPMSNILPQAPTLPSSNQNKKQHSVSDFSSLFGDESDSSSLLSGLTQPGASNHSKSFSGALPDHASSSLSSQQHSLTKTNSPYKSREEAEKRKAAERLASEEKRPRHSKSGLFSPSPQDEKPNIPLSALKSPGDGARRQRSASSSSNKDESAQVSVQKLESMAPEFQAFKNSTGPASIIVGPDGLPSPSKVKKEGAGPSPQKKVSHDQEKRRSSSGPGVKSENGQKTSPVKASGDQARRSEDKKDKDHKKKKEKKEKKDKKEKKHKKDKKRDGGESSDSDKEKKHKKDKKKSKDKDREKEKDKDKGSGDTPRVKIKYSGTEGATASPGPDHGAGGSSSMAAIPTLKLKLSGGTVRKVGEEESASKKDSRKRDRTGSMAKLDKFDVPAAKMARAMGNDPNRESKFLEESFKKKDKR